MTEYDAVLIEIQATQSGSPATKPEQTTDEYRKTPAWVLPGGTAERRSRAVILPALTTATAWSDLTWFPSEALTSDRHEINREMELLDATARTEKVDVFATLLDSLTWENRPADDYAHAVRLCLALGIHRKARQFALEGAARFPEHAGLQELARVFGPANLVRSDLPADQDAALNMQWMREHADEYRGRYVAIKAGELMAVASSYSELFKMIGPVKGKKVLVTQVF